MIADSIIVIIPKLSSFMLERKVEAGRKRKKDMSKWSVYFNSLDPLLEW